MRLSAGMQNVPQVENCGDAPQKFLDFGDDSENLQKGHNYALADIFWFVRFIIFNPFSKISIPQKNSTLRIVRL